jgi:hypothetical protein
MTLFIVNWGDMLSLHLQVYSDLINNNLNTMVKWSHLEKVLQHLCLNSSPMPWVGPILRPFFWKIQTTQLPKITISATSINDRKKRPQGTKMLISSNLLISIHSFLPISISRKEPLISKNWKRRKPELGKASTEWPSLIIREDCNHLRSSSQIIRMNN